MVNLEETDYLENEEVMVKRVNLEEKVCLVNQEEMDLRVMQVLPGYQDSQVKLVLEDLLVGWVLQVQLD